MSFDWSQYYQIADALFQAAKDPSSKEAFCRSSISRSYYAAFNLSYAKRAEFWGDAAAQGAEKHQWTIERFIEFRGSPKEKQEAYNQIGENLRRLRAYRNIADYNEHFEGTPATVAKTALRLSRYVLDNLVKYP